MKLVPNAGRIVRRAHSMWANYLGILCLLAPELIFWLTGRDTNPRLWWWAGIVLIVYGIVGRLKDQGIDKTRSPVAALILAMSAIQPQTPARADPAPYTTADFSAVAVPLVARWEGLRTDAYRDIVGVWTVCYGETEGVQPGDSYTVEECQSMLARRLLEYRGGLHRYFTPTTIVRRLTPERDAAYVSLAYNVGIAGAGRSTATRRLNAGDIPGGCDALTWWNRAGQRVIRGLVRRRADEYRLCMAGLG